MLILDSSSFNNLVFASPTTGTQLPREILENVIKFENAEKLNPPMEKRNKQILTKDLKETVDKLENEMHIREISKIVTKIDFEK